jgi:hypothetical protein
MTRLDFSIIDVSGASSVNKTIKMSDKLLLFSFIIKTCD